MCLTETWQQPEVYSALNEACPPGYSYLEKARCTGRGEGLAVAYRSNFLCLPYPCLHTLHLNALHLNADPLLIYNILGLQATQT